jgi:hypothetical protein
MPTDRERLDAGDRLVVFNARQGIAELEQMFDAA